MAAADFAEYSWEPPLELILAFQVQQWGHAAVFGDSPLSVRTLRRMSVLLNYYNATLSFMTGSHKAAEWAKHNPTHLKMMQHIRELRQNA